jgi:hypothetical protein
LRDVAQRVCAKFARWHSDRVDPGPLEELILQLAPKFKMPGRPISARLCGSLQEASEAPSFYEYFFSFCQRRIPFGDDYESWRQTMEERMRAGHEIAGVGPYI